MKKHIALLAAAAVAMIPTAGAFASTKGPVVSNVEPLVQGPPIIEIVSPLKGAQECLASHLTPLERQYTFGVLSFSDKTGKIGITPEGSSGTFLGQGADDMLVDSLKALGVQVADISPGYRQFFDWSAVRSGEKNVGLLLPDIVITGSFNSLDFLPGGGWQVDGVLKAGGKENRINLALSARAVTMPAFGHDAGKPVPAFNPDMKAGRVISYMDYSKQIVQYGHDAGAAGFIGGGSTRNFLQIDFGRDQREALQYAAHYAMDVVAYRVVRDATGITACDGLFTQEESLAPSK